MKIALKATPLQRFPGTTVLAQTKEEMYESLLSIRGWMLNDTDWTQSGDSPFDADTKEAWRLWRQEFRDITKRINVENVQDYFEISDPPQKGRPSTWVGWEYENYYEIIQIFEDMHLQTQELITYQEQQLQSSHGEHGHVH